MGNINSRVAMKKHLLIVSKSFIYSTKNVNMTKYVRMKDHYSGDILGTTNKKQFKHYEEDGFLFVTSYLSDRLSRIKLLVTLKFLLHAICTAVYRHYFVKKYDLIIAREPILAGPLALLIKLFTGAKLITELNGNYVSPVVWEDIENKFIRNLKLGYSKKAIPFVLKRSNGIKLLYPSQITPYLSEEEQRKHRISCFHEYTPISEFHKSTVEEDFIMTMGYPYNIKGFDILVSAFDKIAHKFPTTQVHLIGYLEAADRQYLESLHSHPDQIKLLKPLEYDAAMEKISKTKCFVLASRTEAMGRVLLESMAHGKPVIGSTADGIPTYIRDGVNGYVFESGNVDQLAEKLEVMLSSGSKRKMLGDAGYEIVMAELSEQQYLERYGALIENACGDGK